MKLGLLGAIFARFFLRLVQIAIGPIRGWSNIDNVNHMYPPIVVAIKTNLTTKITQKNESHGQKLAYTFCRGITIWVLPRRVGVHFLGPVCSSDMTVQANQRRRNSEKGPQIYKEG